MRDLKFSRVFEENMGAWLDRSKGIKRALNEGGSSSTKTYSILQLLDIIVRNTKEFLKVTVSSISIPHMKKGVIRTFKEVLGDEFDDNNWNKTDLIYNYPNGFIEFVPTDAPIKFAGPRRDILYINEASDEIPYDLYTQADIRTKMFVFMDWNPTAEFWVHENHDGHSMINDPSNRYIHSTYKDAVAAGVLEKEIIDKLEGLKETDPNSWAVFGEGVLSKPTGLVYPKYEVLYGKDESGNRRDLSQEELDAIFRKGTLVYGLDFGFSGDPAVLTKNCISGSAIYSDELFYQKGLTNRDISLKFQELGLKKGGAPIYADSSEPKSIEELRRDGWNIMAVEKKPGSVEFGHQKVRQLKQYWTKESVACIKEQRNFKYLLDSRGNPTEKTNHIFSHGMDSRRYAVMGYKGAQTVKYRVFG